MLFPTFAFALFFAVVLPLSWLLRPHALAWRVFVLSASFFFYGYWDARFVVLLAVSIVGNWFLAGAVRALAGEDGEPTASSRRVVRVAVAANLGLLGFFKYFDFFTASATDLLGNLGLPVDPPAIQIILPVGISFFTFQAMSYVIDVHRREIAPMALLDFAVYLSFFPQLVAGPIVRATEFAPQLDTPGDPRRVEAPEGIRLILVGLFKKVVVSSYLASEIVDPVFALPDRHTSLEILVAVYAYAIQIYADFSGYTDIAIGCALLMGFRFPQNFDAPYISRSIQEFWRRWHLTLSRWLRDYLYISLGGNRRGNLLTYRNLALTMVLGGLWHGAAWTFVVWGAIHGAAMVAERYLRARWKPIGLPAPVVAGLQWVLTFHIVCLAWIFFRAPTIGDAWNMIGRIMTQFGPTPAITGLLVLVIGLSLVSQFVPASYPREADRVLARMPVALLALVIAAALTVIDALGPEGVAPFIYFQF
ncbi:MAG: MBOAT family protein [Acidimicrobiales bacterium]